MWNQTDIKKVIWGNKKNGSYKNERKRRNYRKKYCKIHQESKSIKKANTLRNLFIRGAVIVLLEQIHPFIDGKAMQDLEEQLPHYIESLNPWIVVQTYLELWRPLNFGNNLNAHGLGYTIGSLVGRAIKGLFLLPFMTWQKNLFIGIIMLIIVFIVLNDKELSEHSYAIMLGVVFLGTIALWLLLLVMQITYSLLAGIIYINIITFTFVGFQVVDIVSKGILGELEEKIINRILGHSENKIWL